MSVQTATGDGHAHVHLSYDGSKTGMWLFLFTELLLFGGLFLAYAVFRFGHAEAFHAAAESLDVKIGVINTMVLLTSSLTMALSVGALQRGKTGRSLDLLATTIAFSALFLVFKFFEWKAKFDHELLPGLAHFTELPGGEKLFFSLYFSMTGLHGLHVIVGMAVMVWVWRGIRHGTIGPNRFMVLEYTGLYWHLVDLIWIFLLPLFYLTN